MVFRVKKQEVISWKKKKKWNFSKDLACSKLRGLHVGRGTLIKTICRWKCLKHGSHVK